ncbi:cell wall binding repeat-containing protein [Clostridium sp. DL-VIII]|uniref:cell wall-binding protein n=1 Tax=Clostridium sp. DL-VIII TaxID=641107 RepID=UPI00023B051A|nr:cell wall-binding protein [Clostridium sp. DL-VIII]EHJ01966.1 cell wall binding repeat-containing protein [Clostridium sp. DL-VIII]
MRRKYIAMFLVLGILTTIVLPVKEVLASDTKASSTSNKSLNTTITADGWKSESGAWYYLKNGAKATGWIQDSGKWYYLGTDGKMQVGWIQDGGNWYYLNGDGSMAHDTTVGDYYLGSNGAWTTSSTSSSSGSATGISYTELMNRIDSLGFIDKKYYSTSEVGDIAGYDWDWKNTMCGGISVYDKGGFVVQLRKNNSEFHSAVLQIFNWLLPTQGSELDHILATNPQNETLTMDGRTVQIIMYADAINVVITG